MLKREVFKDQTWFDQHVQDAVDTIPRFIHSADNDLMEVEERTSLRYTIFNSQLELMVMQYSRGEDVASLKKTYLDTIKALQEYNAQPNAETYDFQIFDDYQVALWLVSLGHLLDVDTRTWEVLINEIGNEEVDFIYEYLIADQVPSRTIPTKIIYAEKYEFLMRAIRAESEPKKIEYINKFLDTYYHSMSNAFWYDRHLSDDLGFFGYWCFELAALVKTDAIDDSSFANNMFYPRDLLGKKLFRTWEDSERGEADREAHQLLKTK
ncbi:MAG: PoNe immunity protein domain-containing protein [Bacteroidota bacterium]